VVYILKQTEAAPDAYPDAPEGLSVAAAALSADLIWQRIESYVSRRWTARTVAWIVEGPGVFEAPLSPAEFTTFERWDATSEAWAEVTISASALGYILEAEGPYRLTATVGGGSPAPTVPETVNEAFRRLAEYFTETADKPGSGRYSVDVGGLREEYERNPAFLARAIVNSGAGDLLRPFRRA